MKRLLLFASLLLTAAGPAPADKQYQRDEQLLVNPGAENGLTQWTNTGSGTLALTTTAANVAAGAAALSWDAAANNDTLRSARMTVPAGLFGAKCIAGAAIKGGDTSLTLQAVDGSDVVLGSSKLSANTNYAQEVVEFTCPSSGTIALRLISSGNAAAAFLDQAFLGRTTPPYITTTGEPNAVLNPYAARNSSGYASTGAVTVTRLASGGPLSPVYETGLRLDQGSAADYASYCLAVPVNYEQRKLKVQWEQTPEGGAVSGEWKVEVYSSANSDCSSGTEVALSTDSSGDSLLPNLSGRFVTVFDTNQNAYYQVRWIRVTGSNHLDLTEIIVGPGTQPQGAVIGPWLTYTLGNPTNTTTPTTKAAVYRRNGSSIEIKAAFQFGGVATGAVRFATANILPTGLTPDTAALVDTVTQNSSAGTFSFTDASAGSTTNDFTGTTNWANGSGELRFITTTDDEMDATSPVTIASGDLVTFDVRIPIAEWAGSATVNLAQNDVEYAANNGTWDATDTTSFVYGPAGGTIAGALTAARNKTVRFPTPILATDKIELELSSDRVTWLPALGARLAAGSNDVVVPTTSSAGVYSSGISIAASTATDVIVSFRQYMSMANDDAPTIDWPATAYWRVKKSTGGMAVGFGLATATTSGLVATATQTIGGGKTLDGSADQVQLTVRGHGTQTTDLLLLEQDGGTDSLTVSNSGVVVAAGTVTGAGLSSTLALSLSGDAHLVGTTVAAATSCDSSCGALSGSWACIGAKTVSSSSSTSCSTTSGNRRCLCLSENSNF